MLHSLPMLALRFALGGVIVSVFALAGDVLRPRTFAGVFAAAPSVALASLALAFVRHGGSDVARSGRSMLLGGVALGVYSLVSTRVLARHGLPVALGAALLWSVWLVVAFALLALVSRI